MRGKYCVLLALMPPVTLGGMTLSISRLLSWRDDRRARRAYLRVYGDCHVNDYVAAFGRIPLVTYGGRRVL